jgi:hypothetical protein
MIDWCQNTYHGILWFLKSLTFNQHHKLPGTKSESIQVSSTECHVKQIPFEFLSWKIIYCALAICSLYWNCYLLLNSWKKHVNPTFKPKTSSALWTDSCIGTEPECGYAFLGEPEGWKLIELNSGGYTSSKRSKQRPGGVVLSLELVCSHLLSYLPSFQNRSLDSAQRH